MRTTSIWVLLICWLCFVPSFTSCSTTQSKKDNLTTTIYLVRHAEKENDSTDPDLNQKGRDRADRLSRLMQVNNVQYIYSSDYKRTRQTAAPLARSIPLDITIYDPRHHDDLVEQLKKHSSETSLVIGHSNSIPTLANLLVQQDLYTSLNHEEYNKIYVITCDKQWHCHSEIILF